MAVYFLFANLHTFEGFLHFDKVDARCFVTKTGLVLFLYYNFSKLCNGFEFCFVFFTRKLIEILLYISK